MQATIVRNDLEVCLKEFWMKYWPCRGQNFTSRVCFTQNPSDLGHPPFGWSHDKGQELNRQRDNTVFLFPQRWSICSEILLTLPVSWQFHGLYGPEPWLQSNYCEVTVGKKAFKSEKTNPYWQWIQCKTFLLNCTLSWLLEERIPAEIIPYISTQTMKSP